VHVHQILPVEGLGVSFFLVQGWDKRVLSHVEVFPSQLLKDEGKIS